ncbi:MAG: tetratricopeptide repeat protein [Alphaproteobacteria bacterium]|nr:tetratricopeptide repeat protein [Alphaproteobacteria bacterium]
MAALLASCSAREEQKPGFEAARVALARGDGLTAENRLNALLEQGHGAPELAAYLGEAALQQDDLAKARRWLGDGTFSPSTAALGFRMLGQLEMREDRLAAAGAAFDRALRADPQNAELWVDIGRLRYRGGEQVQAIAAAERALAVDPGNSAALRFRAQLVRDSQGPRHAIPWLETALEATPGDVGLLTDYAATLGDAGEAAEALAALRRASELSPRAPRLAFLNAVIAARAGEFDLARSLLMRAPTTEIETPAALLLSGILDLELGQYASAAQTFDRLAQIQPDNQRVDRLLARSLMLSGGERELVARLAERAAEPRASPYLKTLVGRALETLDRRQDAAVLLDAAARPSVSAITPLPSRTRPEALRFDRLAHGADLRDFVREYLRTGQTDRAVAEAGRFARQHAGSGDAQALLGDALLAAGDGERATRAYLRAAQIRRDWPLIRRLVAAHMMEDDAEAARNALERYLSGGASEASAAGFYGGLLAERGEFASAAAVLDSALDHGARSDPAILALRSEMAAQLGDDAGARQFAWRAYKLQPLFPPAIRALARVTEDQALAARLEDKYEKVNNR